MRELIVGAVVWLAGIGWGFSWFAGYSNRPSSSGTPHGRTGSGRWELVFAVHPKCSCTRPGLRILSEFLQRRRERLSTTILVRQVDNAVWPLPVEIPGARVVADPGGNLARKLGLETSGHAVLYRPDGSLAFTGGLTASRGSESPGRGPKVIADLLDGKTNSDSQPVFGCGLFAPSEAVE